MKNCIRFSTGSRWCVRLALWFLAAFGTVVAGQSHSIRHVKQNSTGSSRNNNTGNLQGMPDVGANAQQYPSFGFTRSSVAFLADDQRPFLFAFGTGRSGRLGTGNEDHQNSPVAVNNDDDWKQVAAGGEHSLAIKSDGTLWAWGSGSAGRLGTGNTDDQYYPVQIGEATDWKQVGAGAIYSVALKTDGTLWVWGSGWNGALGTGSTDDQLSPVQIGEATDWSEISAGYYHCLAMKSDGSLWAWGGGSAGRLGTGNTEDQLSPVQIGEATDWKQVSAGEMHSLAIKSDGTLWAWGGGSNGKLGTGNTDSQHHPVQIGEASDWARVSAGRWFSVATKSDGTLWTWGQGVHLGIGDVDNQYFPMKVGEATDWKQISAGMDHTLAIKADGTLWAWGHGLDGALGTGSVKTEYSPIQIGNELYSYVSAGGLHSLVLRKYATEDPISPDASGIIYVRKGSTGNGSSWENAAGELADALFFTQNRSDIQQIWVAAGEYQPAAGESFSMKEGVKIYGGFASTGNPAFTDRNWNLNRTVLSGNGNVVVNNTSNGLTQAAVLDGFTVSGGRSSRDGAGIRNIDTSPLLQNLIVEDNVVEVHSSGIFNKNGSPVIRECIIRNNRSGFEGSGIANNGASVTMINLLITGNYAGSYGSAVRGIFGGDSKLINCTITGNTTGYGSGGSIMYNAGATIEIKNSIISETHVNLYGQDSHGNDSMIPFTLSNSLIKGVAADPSRHLLDGTLNPVFVDSENGDFRLQMTSPARNAGNNAYFDNLGAAFDLGGNSRLYDGTIDLGAFENQDVRNISIRYVKVEGVGDGYSWQNASGDLQAMINASAAGNEVWVAAGEYQPTSGQFFSMKEGVKIYGGFSATGTPEFTDRNWNQHTTTLKGNGNSVIVNDNNGLTNAARLDGFTITGGSAVTGGGMLNHLAYPLINHCVFKGNHAIVWGGGIYNDGPGMTTIVNSLIYQNTAQSGAGAFSYQNAKPRFTNVTMTGNTAEQNGGALHNYEGAETELVNAIVWGNSQGAGSSQLYTGGEGKTKAYFSVLEGGAAAIIGGQEMVDIVSGNPLFTDAANGDFTLQGCSPALNLGTGSVLHGFTTDLGGNPRTFNSIVDAGAYEYQSAPLIGGDRLAVNGNTASVDITSGQTYAIQAADDACRSVALIVSNGVSPVSGMVHIVTQIDNTVQTRNSSPYVQRHYDISPVSGASDATARITLYFTQSEFSAYNTTLGRMALPASPDGDQSSVRVFQYHGSPKVGESGPGAYTGAPATIIPEVNWNSGLARWELSFDVTGFSGFFVGSADAALPVKLVSFEARQAENNKVALQWQVTDQVDMAKYTVERSVNARDFNAIGAVDANRDDESRYQFTDANSYSESFLYYRLKMTELDGSFSYSKIISVALAESDLVIYPVPARDFVRVKGKGIAGTSLMLVNAQGIILKTVAVASDNQEINLTCLPTGIYFLKTLTGRTQKIVKE